MYFLTIGAICIPLFVMHDKYVLETKFPKTYDALFLFFRSSNLPQIVANLFVLVIVNGLFLMAVIPASEVEIEVSGTRGCKIKIKLYILV
jgi:hypothetical protein